MDMGVIATLKLRYRRISLFRITLNIEERDKLRDAAKHLKAGMKGLDEEHDSHMRDVPDLIYQAWEQITEKTIARCWVKADILPRAVHGALLGIFGKVKQGEKVDEQYDVEMEMIINGLKHLKLSTSSSSDLAERINEVSYEDVEEWTCVESNELVQAALVEEIFDNIANIYMIEEYGDGTEVLDRREVEESNKHQIESATEVFEAFREVEMFAENVGDAVACDAIRTTKRTLLGAVHAEKKKRKRQTLMVECFLSKFIDKEQS